MRSRRRETGKDAQTAVFGNTKGKRSFCSHLTDILCRHKDIFISCPKIFGTQIVRTFKSDRMIFHLQINSGPMNLENVRYQ